MLLRASAPRACVVLSALALAACGGPPDPGDGGACPDGGPWWCPYDGGDASSRDAPAADAPADAPGPDAPLSGDFVPYISGDFYRAYAPPGTRYLNDHTIVRGDDGYWHLIGITHESNGSPHEERSLLHARSRELLGPWMPLPDALTADPAMNERVLWAPHVVRVSPSRWSMFYWAEWIRPEDPLRGLRRADSADDTFATWRRAEGMTPASSQRPPGGRDAFAFRVGESWLLYSVAATADAHGQIVVTETRDPTAASGWSDLSVAAEDPVAVPEFPWGNLESPFVVPYGGQYYLFVTRTGPGHTDYVRTIVLRSANPRRFAWQPITDMRAHAAEVVVDAGRYYLTSAGWTGEVGAYNRGLLIAPLRWARK